MSDTTSPRAGAAPDAGALERSSAGRPHSLWTAEDVAAFLKVSTSMVYKLRREGSLPFIRVGTLYRFDPEAVRGLARGEVVPLRRRR